MATATKRQPSKAGQRIKGAYGTAKQKTKQYATAIEEAYAAGYRSGWQDRDQIPDVPGARASAVTGYRQGMKARGRSNKSQQRYQQYQSRGGKK